MKKTSFQKGYDKGYHQCMHDHNIIHGKAAKKLMEQVMNPKPMTKKQKKFMKSCEEIYNQLKKEE